MYRRLAECMSSHTDGQKVLAISHSAPLCRLVGLGRCQITEADYPDVNMLQLPFADESFDYVISDQVLEHIEGDPQQAIDETFRVLKPGGIAVHTTCFIYPTHMEPADFWRFTPWGLQVLCKRFGRLIETGSWGNRWAWLLVALGLQFEGIPERPWHPLNKLATLNEPRWPIVTWVVAQK
jgi:SAM-dependent methyltransferase